MCFLCQFYHTGKSNRFLFDCFRNTTSNITILTAICVTGRRIAVWVRLMIQNVSLVTCYNASYKAGAQDVRFQVSNERTWDFPVPQWHCVNTDGAVGTAWTPARVTGACRDYVIAHVSLRTIWKTPNDKRPHLDPDCDSITKHAHTKRTGVTSDQCTLYAFYRLPRSSRPRYVISGSEV